MFSLRKVKKGDINLLFDWVNDFAVRNNAKNFEPITRDEHSFWLADKLADPEVHMYILTNSQENIGIVRFEKKKDEFIISYSIDKHYRGKGLGELILAKGIKKISLICNCPNFIAYVKKGNVPSEKIFNKLGFILKEVKDINNVKFNIYQKKHE